MHQNKNCRVCTTPTSLDAGNIYIYMFLQSRKNECIRDLGVPVDWLWRPLEMQVKFSRFGAIQFKALFVFTFQQNSGQCQDTSSHVILQWNGIQFKKKEKKEKKGAYFTKCTKLLIKNYLPKCVMVPNFQNEHIMQSILYYKVKCLIPDWIQAFIHNLHCQRILRTIQFLYLEP